MTLLKMIMETLGTDVHVERSRPEESANEFSTARGLSARLDPRSFGRTFRDKPYVDKTAGRLEQPRLRIRPSGHFDGSRAHRLKEYSSGRAEKPVSSVPTSGELSIGVCAVDTQSASAMVGDQIPLCWHQSQKVAAVTAKTASRRR